MDVIDLDGLDGMLHVPGEGIGSKGGLFALANTMPAADELAGPTAVDDWSMAPATAEVEEEQFVDEELQARVMRAALLTMPHAIDRRSRRGRLVAAAAGAVAVGALALAVTLLVSAPPPASASVPGAMSHLDTDPRPLPAPAGIVTKIRIARPAPAADPFRVSATRLEWHVPAHFGAGFDRPVDFDSAAMHSLAAALTARCVPGSIVVIGHTCSLGPPAKNLLIGKRRARHARKLLVGAGLTAESVHTLSAAATDPEADNATEDGRARNRRATVACRPRY